MNKIFSKLLSSVIPECVRWYDDSKKPVIPVQTGIHQARHSRMVLSGIHSNGISSMSLRSGSLTATSGMTTQKKSVIPECVRWHDDSKKSVIASEAGQSKSLSFLHTQESRKAVTHRSPESKNKPKDWIPDYYLRDDSTKQIRHSFITNIIKLIFNNFRSLIPYPLALTTVFMAFSLAHAGPSVITNLTASTTCQTQLQLTWTAPENGFGGTCSSYLVKYSTTGDIVDDAAFNSASTFPQSWPPRNPSAIDKKILTGLIPSVTYYFSIKSEFGSLYSVQSTTGTNGGIAGPFDIHSTLPGGAGSTLCWGDYDNDGDLDLLFSGNTANVSGNTHIFRNDSGTFVTLTPGPGVAGGAVAWGDYDNDGDLDYAVCGSVLGVGSYSRIYKNNAGSFSDIGAGLPGLSDTSVAWGDYDNDGDLDLALANYIYRNDSGTFSYITGLSGGVSYGALGWGDYDNDGDLDLATCGGNTAYIYRNDSGAFLNINAGLTGVNPGSLAWGDYDNDGDLDLVVCGSNSTKLYRNNTGSFSNVASGLTNYDSGTSVAWGDYDNDGDLDLSINGRIGSIPKNEVFQNNSGSFSNILAGLTATYVGSATWGDYDNDGDLDLAISGYEGWPIYRTLIYRSYMADFGAVNTAPTAPSSGFGADFNTTTGILQFRWDPGSDTETTETKGLYYLVRVSTTTPINDTNSNKVSWRPASPLMGNYRHGYVTASSTQCGFNYRPRLTDTTYYWQVRTIDTALKESAWSVEQSTYVPPGPSRIFDLSLQQSFQLRLSWTAPGGVTGYLVKYSTTANIATEEDFAAATTFYQSWVPASPGTGEAKLLTGLLPEVTHYFSIKGFNGSLYSVLSSTANGAMPSPFVSRTTLLAFLLGSLAWGDYDNDGDLDLAASGSTSSGARTYIYRNDAGVFNSINPGLPNMYWSSMSWGDYDNDGDLDLAISGYDDLAYIYRNNDGSFVNINAGLSGVDQGSIAWGDYDNDGDLDLALCGSSKSNIYRNDSGAFNNINAGLTGVSYSSLAWGDYDNDGDLDLALSGYNSTSPYYYSLIYHNDSGAFNNINAGLTGVSNSSLAWGDYDNDGDLDLVLSGSDSGSVRRSYIYRNDSGAFNNINAGLTGVYYSSLAWGDFDNDGDLDLAVSGQDSGSVGRSFIYRNNSGSFSDIAAGLSGVFNSSLAWGDFDNDGDLDLALAGSSNGAASGASTYIYHSCMAGIGNVNTAPSAPSDGFGSDYNSTTGVLQLRWGYGSDAQTTDPKGLNYTVRVSTITPISDSNSKFVSWRPATPFLGNYPHGYIIASSTQCGLNFHTGLTDTTYYWQVRSIDTALKESDWSVEQSTYVPLVLLPIPNVSVQQDFQLKLSWLAPVGAAGYLIKYSTTNNITTENEFSAATTFYQNWTPAAAGSGETKYLTGLIPLATYYFSIKWSNGSAYSIMSSSASGATASPFSIHTSTFTGVYNSSLAWGDYDNDGDLDLALSGHTGSAYVSYIYRNDSGTFNNINTGLSGVFNSSLAWGDYDNDGDLDLAVSGTNGSTYYCDIYRNNSGSFVNINAGLTGVDQSSLAWGDFDNDGDPDLAVLGNDGNGAKSYLYRNDSGAFNNVNAGFVAVSYGSLAWGDYDNDGDLDLAITGNGTYIYRNNSGSFVNINAGLTGFTNASLAWGDYDNDGDLDLAVMGYSSGGKTYIYRNNSGAFANINAGLTAVYMGSLAWGDYDNDGDLDLAVSGYFASNNNKLYIYSNDGGAFNIVSAGLTGVRSSSLAWGDYDNDGDLDLAVSGEDSSSVKRTMVYRSYWSETGTVNTAPSAPSGGFGADYDTETGILQLRWDYGSDTLTPDKGLYYTVRVSTLTPISDSNSNVISWRPSTPFLGSYPHGYITASSTQCGLNFRPRQPDATYYWQVRAIDTALKESDWSVEQSTYVPAFVLPIFDLVVRQDYQLRLSWTVPGSAANYLVKYSTTANITTEEEFSAATTFYQNWTPAASGSGELKILTGLLPEVTYFFSIKWSNGSEYSVISSSTSGAMANPFSINSSAPGGFYYGALAWGDYDNDGDLDLAVSGYDSGNTPRSYIYRNNSGAFVNINAGLTAVTQSSFAWGDYDNDGDLDLAVSGSGITYIYRNNSGSFANINAGLTGVYNSALAWGDYDNDGDLDLAVSGSTNGGSSGVSSRIYRNDLGSFNNIAAPLTNLYYGSIAWGDYDNDGDLDLANFGTDIGNTRRSYIYRNDSVSFNNINAALAGLYNGSLAWGDYDNDGDLDLAVCGDTGSPISYIYRNDSGAFNNINAGLTGVQSSSLGWGDYDNDGDLDLAVSGYVAYDNYKSYLYRNNAGVFDNISAGLTGLSYGSLAWGDYDNDGDLDLALCGQDAIDVKWFYIYNGCYSVSRPNTQPSAPSGGFSSSFDQPTMKMTFSWDYGSDAETTVQKGLYYTVRASTNTPITDTNANIISWRPSTPFFGNYPHGYRVAASTQSGAVLTAQSEGSTYYWQVRTIDTGFSSSDWSETQNTYVTPIKPSAVTSLAGTRWTPEDSIKLSWASPGDDGYVNNITGGKFGVKYSTGPSDTWDTMPFYVEWTTNTTPSSPQTRIISGLNDSSTYYFFIKAQDEIEGNWSELSNSATAFTLDTAAPGTITSLVSALGPVGRSITLSWVSPGDNGYLHDIETGGQYEIKYSTVPYFASDTTSVVFSTAISPGMFQQSIITGLRGFTTYYFAVKTADEVPFWSALSNITTAYCHGTPIITYPAFTQISTATVTVNWALNGNNLAQYLCEVSTHSDYSLPLSSSGWLSYDTSSARFDPLSINTTFYFRAKSIDNIGIESPWLVIGDTSTYAVAVGAPTILGYDDDTFQTYTLVAISSSGASGINPPWTEYAILNIETGGWLQGDGSTGTVAVWKTIPDWETNYSNRHAGLAPYSSYSYRVRTRNNNLIETAISPIGSGLTPSGPPSTITVAEENDDKLKITWSSVGPAISYNVYYATATDGVWTSSFTGIADITYSDDFSGSVSTTTGVALTPLSTTQITIDWDTCAVIESATRYYKVTTVSAGGESRKSAVGSGDRFITPIITAYNIYRDGAFLTTVSSDTLTHTDTGLLPNTSYAFQIAGYSSDSVEGPLSVSTMAWTRAQTAGAPAISDVLTHQANFTIDISGNSQLTEYAIALSSDNWTDTKYLQNSAFLSSTIVWNTTASWHSVTTDTIKGLNSGTEYKAKVKSRNVDAVEQPFSEETSFTTLLATAPFVTAVTTGTISFEFIRANDRQDTQYAVALSTDNWATFKYLQVGGTTSANTEIWQTTTAWNASMADIITGLVPNHNYLVKMKSRNSALEADNIYGYAASTYTLANTPIAAAYSNLAPNVIRANWNANLNSNFTEYYAENITKTTNSGWTTNLYWQEASLAPNTSFYYQVRARNYDAIQTSTASLGYKYTYAHTPSTPTLTTDYDLVNEHYIDIAINSDANPDYTQYAIYGGNSGDGYGWLQGDGTVAIPGTPVWKTKAQWEIEGINRHNHLSYSTDYDYSVRARNVEGVETANGTATHIITLPPKVTLGGVNEMSDDFLRASWAPLSNTLYYIIYRSSASDGVFTQLSTTTAITYDDDIDGSGPTVIPSLSFSNVTNSSIQLNWDIDTELLTPSTSKYYQVSAVTTGGEGPKSDIIGNYVTPIVSGYRVYRFGVIISTSPNLSTTSYINTPLAPNTSSVYELSVITSDSLEGTKSSQYTKWSLANTPLAPSVSADWDAVNLYRCYVTVNTNSNSSYTEYAVTIASMGAFGNWWVGNDGLITQTTYWSTNTLWLNKGLTGSTSYYYKVTARNMEGAYTVLSPQTLGRTPPIPGPKFFAMTSRAPTYISWTWVDPGDDETGFKVYATTGGTVSPVLIPNTTFWTEYNLLPNTTYARYAKAIGPGPDFEESFPSNATAFYTLMPNPDTVSFVSFTTTTITVANSFAPPNISSASSGVYFYNTTSSTVSGWLQTNSWTSSNLGINKQYAFKLKLRNGDAVETPETSLFNKYTAAETPGAPTLFKPTDKGFQIIFKADNNPDYTTYSIKVSTLGDTDLFVQQGGTVAPTAFFQTKASWGVVTSSGLSAMTTYYVSINARNGDNDETPYSTVSTVRTWGFGPTLAGGYDPTLEYYITVTINQGDNTTDTKYAVWNVPGGWLDGNGGLLPTETYELKSWWDGVPFRNAHTNLEPAKMYSYRVFAQDPVSSNTVVSAQISIHTPPSNPLFNSVSEKNSDYLELKWSLPSVGETLPEFYNIYSAASSSGTLVFVSSTTELSFLHDIDGSVPEKVASLAPVVQSSTTVALSWGAVTLPSSSAARYYRIKAGNDGGEGPASTELSGFVTPTLKAYKLYRDNVLLVTLSSSSLSYTDSSLLPDTTYSYRVAALSTDDLEGSQSDAATVLSFPKGIPLPDDVVGLKLVSSDGATASFSFSPVTKRSDGKDIGNQLKGYTVYRSNALAGPWTLIKFIPYGSAAEFSDAYAGALYYYRVKAQDTYNQESEGLMIVNSNAAIAIMSEDNNASLTFDDQSRSFLYGDTNTVGADIRIVLEKIEDNSNANIYCTYRLRAYNTSKREELTGEIVIPKTRLGPRLVLIYKTASNAAKLASRAQATKELPAMYWNNTIKWVKVNGELDQTEGSVSLRTKLLGSYSVRLASRGDKFAVTGVEPKIFSPDESNTIISKARIYIDNPNYSEIRSTIFDMDGRVLRSSLPREQETVLYWDGRDSDERIVPSGVYIYQIEADGRAVNGTIVVAR